MLSLTSLLNPKRDMQIKREIDHGVPRPISSPMSLSEPKTPVHPETISHPGSDSCHSRIPLPLAPRAHFPGSPRSVTGSSLYNNHHQTVHRYHASPTSNMPTQSFRSVSNGNSPYALSSGYSSHPRGYMPDNGFSPSPQRMRDEQFAVDHARVVPIQRNMTVQLYHGPTSSMVSRHRLGHSGQRDSQFPKSPITGPVNYPPFENLDDTSTEMMRRFKIQPSDHIGENSSHIPYNSGKKDFFEKTGRESFEVFSYSYTMPDSSNEFYIMWDYNNGLVRMTPFFKCCNYGKTVPAKMLSQNPGLKEITHSITGGTILAQGYWMPFECARAICTTFCHNIAGALIPIFGPDFPRDCIVPGNSDFGRMVISPLVINKCAAQAQIYRRECTSLLQNHRQSPGTGSVSPARGNQIVRRSTPESPFFNSRAVDSPYTTDTEDDAIASPVALYMPPRHFPLHNPHLRQGPRYRHMQAPTSSGWTPVNQATYETRSNREVHESSAVFSREASVELRPHLSGLPSLNPRSSSPVGRPLSFQDIPPRPVTGKRRMEGEHVASVTRYSRMGQSDLSQYKYSRSTETETAPASFTQQNIEDLTLPPITGLRAEAERKDAAMLLIGLRGMKRGDDGERADDRRERNEMMSAVAQEAIDAMGEERRKSL